MWKIWTGQKFIFCTIEFRWRARHWSNPARNYGEGRGIPVRFVYEVVVEPEMSYWYETRKE